MRRLDLIGMILMIIAINIFLGTGYLAISTPPYIFNEFKMAKVVIIVLFIVGVLTFIIGTIIRIYDSFTKNKGIEREYELTNNFINYLKANKGRAFTMNALFNKIDNGSQFRGERKNVEELFEKLRVINEIKVELKDKQKFYMYTGES
jgi:hypothetical protein